MLRNIESVGARLIGLFVPKVEASAGCAYMCYASCWQCNYNSCIQYTNCSIKCL
ncbi:hypothetical protein GCM10010149_45130 [Nonomuraea roseoviolacea subsp. roseoviolacea]|uniref:Uncharacterized protein n=1 Tax=Nonomuraea roseoviolacea subsp. carminata TaxID=160689 RepID=A0ABT1K237_9ACTN|nr:hypothetical protein [Nonomuraea roseoviolacea]MCP2347074.1 hypothetical protein [Nonomuraea roseoviolacea subsp. carminata]